MGAGGPCASVDALARFERGELSVDERGSLLDHAAVCESCHAAITVAMSEATSSAERASPTERVDRYTLGRVIGRGAMGVVYVANDPELGRDVALKILRPLASPERLRREAQALAKLTHPNVVRVYDIGTDGAHTFIAMELVDGENLREWLASPRALDETLAVLAAAGQGLAAAHAVGLVHRDFKPDNVLVARRGDVLVGDFGLARIMAPGSQDGAPTANANAISSDELTATGAVVGTPAYMAPEQIDGDAHAASDQYAFCVTAWEALFGRRPFDGATLADLRANARANRIVRPDDRDVPRDVESALRRGLAEDAAARFPSMEALLGALGGTQRGSRRRWIAAGAVAVALGGSGAAWLAMRSPAIDCDAAGRSIESAWGARVHGIVNGRFDARVAGAFASYASQWQRARIDACVATHVRHEQSAATLDRRVACLDRARAALHTTVSMLVANGETLTRPDVVVESLPALERCDAAQASAPPLVNRGPLATVESELTELEVHLAGGTSSLSLAETVAVRVRAEKLGYTPTTLRARMLEARVAAWTGDRNAAEAILRDVIVEAERANDDAARAFASAQLASLVAAIHTDEAAQLVAGGRAALARAGGDPQIDEALLGAEVDILEVRGDLRGAATLQEKLVGRIEARLPSPTRTTAGAYNKLGRLWGLAPDYDKSRAAFVRALEVVAIIEPAADPQQHLFRRAPLDLSMLGDFDGAVALGHQQVAYLRSLPDSPKRLVAYLLGMVGSAHEWNLDHPRCVEVHREVEKAWSLPSAAYLTPTEPPNEAEIVNGRINAIFGIGSCLFKQRRFAAALSEFRRAHELAVAGGDSTAAQLPSLERLIGVTLFEAGDARAARSHLEPLVPGLVGGTMPPISRALLRFALARALWLDAGTSDRPRARALAEDAIRDLDEGLGLKDATTGPMRKAPILLRERRAAIEKWLAEHQL